jgi:hypothetical protein
MGRQVHTGLGSSSLVSHVPQYPPPPHANSFVLGPAVINTHTHANCISLNLCPCLTRSQHFAPICRSATRTRAGSPSVSPSHLPRPCGVSRWGALGLQAIAMRAQLRSSRRRIMLLSSISLSGSPTILHSLLSRMCHADAKGTLWVVRVLGTTSIHALLILPIGLERTITS